MRVRSLASTVLLALASLACGGGGSAPTGTSTPAPSPVGSFTAVGNLNAARDNHSATLLQNGKVLITGGGALAGELFDPVTRTFVLTGARARATTYTSSVLLPSGKVLVVGSVWTPELYDPLTGQFTATGSPGNTVVTAPSLTLLADGRVLMSGLSQGRTEFFNPSTNSFSAGPTSASDMFLSNAVRLLDGRVLLASESHTELFQPSTNSFRTGPPPPVGAELAFCLLPDGRVLFMGRSGAALFTPGVDAFTPLTSNVPTAAWSWPTSLTVLPSGLVLVQCFASTDPVWIFNPATQAFQAGPKSITARISGSQWLPEHTTTRLQDGGVLLAGGLLASPGSNTDRAEVYR